MVRRPVFRPFQHPRGPNGRFTESRTSRLDAKGKQRAAAFQSRFSPRKVSSPDEARTYLTGLSGTKGPDPAVGTYLSDPRPVNNALRAGSAGGSDVATLDGAMAPLPDDVQGFRRVPATAFAGIDPKSLVGTKVRDAAFFPATLAPPKGAPSDVLLHLSLPAGTKAAPVPDASTVVVDRGVDMAVTEATDRPDGGVDLHLVALPDGVEPAGGETSPDTTTPVETTLDEPPSADSLTPLDVGGIIDAGVPGITDPAPQPLRDQLRADFAAAFDGAYGGLTVPVGRVDNFGGGWDGDLPGVVVRRTITDADGTQVGT